jgi:hypothetical protein
MWGAIDLGTFRDRSLVPLLIELLKSPETVVRRGAAMALGETGDAVAVEPLRKALRRERHSPAGWYMNRHAYRKALIALRGPSPVDTARRLLHWLVTPAILASLVGVVLILTGAGFRDDVLPAVVVLFGLLLVVRIRRLALRLARRILKSQ